MTGAASRWVAGLIALTVLAVAGSTATANASISPPVPVGWQVDASATGDLNGDGTSDVAIVLRRSDPKLIVHNDGLGTAELDTNPRRLVIYFRQGSTFREVAATLRLLPSAASTESTCLADPFEDGGIAIARQVLSISLNFWMSCGGWGTSTNTYKFKREGSRFRLIGFDHMEFMRNSGEGEKFSVNFLTGRKSQTPFAIDDSIPEKYRWSRIRPQRHYLDSLELESCPAVDDSTALC
jgi:hypothetical protein